MTRSLIFKTILVLVLAFVFYLILPYFTAPAQACVPGETQWFYQACSSYSQYKCQDNANCSADILKRTCNREKKRECTCNAAGDDWNCPDWSSCYGTGCGGSVVHTNCQNWELCIGNTSWGALNHSCNCAAECLGDPQNAHLEDGIGPVSNVEVDLPLKFAWNPVGGAQSYWYRAWKIDPPTTTAWGQADAKTSGTTTATKIVPDSGNETPCFLPLPGDSTYSQSTSTNWQIAPCCKDDGTDCKDWADVSTHFFEISLNPQPLSPADPDWNNTPKKAENVSLPVTLDWCDVREAEYYKLKFYEIKKGVESCHPYLTSNGDCLYVQVNKGTTWPYGDLTSSFVDDRALYFWADNEYRWEAASCLPSDLGVEDCSDYGQKWGLDTTSTLPLAGKFELISPSDNSTIGFPAIFRWNQPIGIQAIKYEIGPQNGITSGSFISLDFPDLALNTSYTWRARPCASPDGTNCEKWSPKWNFKTTGAAPSLNNPENNKKNVVIPIKFDWDDVPAAGSYRIQVANNAAFNNPIEELLSFSEILIDYPDLQMTTEYWWRVQTCAYADGDPASCGSWSNVQTFTTFQIGDPINLVPSDGTEIKESSLDLGWDAVAGAKTYQYIVYKPDGTVLFDKMTSSNRVSHYTIEFPEIGIYTWKVKACLDKDGGCVVGGNWSKIQSFDLALIAPPEMKGGLVPCGRTYENPDTPWSERESCQIKHIFLLLRNGLDFFLWKITTVILILILLVAGLLFYISHGDTHVIFKVKSLLRSVVIGYILIFLSWLIVNLFLSLIGFKFQFFGHWWDIPF